MIVPENFEMDTVKFIEFIEEMNLSIQKQENDLAVYSNVIKKILNLPIKNFDNGYYISLTDINNICEHEFKKLSKYWKDKK